MDNSRAAFFCYLDEFQNITPQSIVDGLSELRKYKLGFILAHQYVEQLSKELKESVLGNAGTIISFRLGAGDARTLVPEFKPVFDQLERLSVDSILDINSSTPTEKVRPIVFLVRCLKR